MFIYLSKKIAIPNGINLHSLAWNPDQGWIACGGDSGLLKVLKLELTVGAGRDPKNARGNVAVPSNLSMNQTLDGHHGKVICVTWNALYRKLTTSDETGLIIVWMLHKGMWFEEMINNRNKSVVRDMKWTADGTKICIVYEDGAVIVGSVDGNRLWGKELDFQLALVEWSPDSKYILFVSTDTKVYAYDAMGNKIKRVTLKLLDHPTALHALQQDKQQKRIGAANAACQIVAISWYDGAEGHSDHHAPTLAVALGLGLVQLSRGLDDLTPIIIDTKLEPLTQCKWDTKGSVLAVAGLRKGGDGRDVSAVQFYDCRGAYLRTLKVPGGGINALTWEGGGLRIALAVDAYIYFANIRPDYKWGYMHPTAPFTKKTTNASSSLLKSSANAAAGSAQASSPSGETSAVSVLGGQGTGQGTLAYSFTRPDRSDASVMFWDLATDEKNTVQVGGLRHLACGGENCVVVSGPEPSSGVFKVVLCNAIGAPVDTKFTPAGMTPLFVAMTPFHVIVADQRCVYVWQYRTQVLKLTAVDSGAGGVGGGGGGGLERRAAGRERVVDVREVEKAATGDSQGSGGGGGAGGGCGGEGEPAADMAAASMVTAKTLEDFVYPDSDNNKQKQQGGGGRGGGGDDEGGSGGGGGGGGGDRVCAVAATDKTLVVSLESGVVHRYSLPHVSLEQRNQVKCRPSLLRLNCDSSLLALVDSNGQMSVLDFDAKEPSNSPSSSSNGLSGGYGQGGDEGGGTSAAAAAVGGAAGYAVGSSAGGNGVGRMVGDGKGGDLERKDAWDVCWSSDHPRTFALMEKTRMFVFEDMVPQAPILSSGYLASFHGCEVKAVMLDEVMLQPDKPQAFSVVDFETDALRTLRELIESKGCGEAFEHVEKLATTAASTSAASSSSSSSSRELTREDSSSQGHLSGSILARLWRQLAESSLLALELGVADKALVRCGDYNGIQLVKRLTLLGNGGGGAGDHGGGHKLRQRAEVLAALGRFDEAESVYRDMDRKDLAVDLRVRVGDWFKVVSLIQTGGAGSDKLLRQAMTQIGFYYSDRRQWGKAVHYFTQGKELAMMAECYYHTSDFDKLAKLVSVVPVGALTMGSGRGGSGWGAGAGAQSSHSASSSLSSSLSGVPGQEDGGGGSQGSSLLLELAARLESVGLHESAVEAYLKAGQPRKAIDCAVLLNQWSRAVELAEEFEFPQIEGLLAKKAAALKAKGDRLGAVELYRRANKSTDAAKMLATIAEEVVAQDSDPLRAKKLNVLAALEVERFRKAATAGIALSGHGDGDIAQTTAATLDTLMTMDDGAGDSRAASKVLDNAWRGAAAYHYFLLAQRQLYGQKMDDAMKTSIRLAEYEDILEPRAIYCLVALTAYHNKYFGICSRAFVKLETMPSLSEEQRDQVQTLAMHIFTKHSPLDPQPLAPPYLDCLENGTPYAACTASGRLISDGPNGGSLGACVGVGAGGPRALASQPCRHSCLERMAASTIHCPLCHAPLM